MRLLAAFDRYWFAPVPAERLAVLRILIGGYALAFLVIRFSNLRSVVDFADGEFAPVGIVQLLSTPLPSGVVTGLTMAAVLSGVPFVLGWHYALFGPLFGVLFLWVTSYRNSWGMLFHTESLVALHLLLLSFAPAADALSRDARPSPLRVAPTEPPASSGSYGWAIRAMAWVTVIAYVIAGIAKFKMSGSGWLDGELLRRHIAYDNLRKIELGSFHSLLGAELVRHAFPFRVLAPLTLLLELGAPVALLGRRYAQLWSGSAFLFHAGILLLMAIPFPYHLLCIAYAPFFEVERLPAWLFSLVKKRKAARAARAQG